MSDNHTYIAIDLKSFYASVECVQRGLDPLTTNLVVADPTRTEKTICLAVSPSLKAYGISGRARLFELIVRLNEVNSNRRAIAPNRQLTGKSYNDTELKANSSLEIDYICAPPRMALYMKISSQIYNVYLRYIAPEDIHVYSIDEVFIDCTAYLKTYKLTARELAERMVKDVLNEAGITATVGIATNLYLCKVAMDIMAKTCPPDEHGVRIAELDEMSYRRQMWGHKPITDFWRVGKGTASRLASRGLYTMGDIAFCSTYNEDMLYRMFGVNAELLIDHAWGWEPCTIQDIKAYRPESSSLSTGQVLQTPYNFEKGRLIVREMTDLLTLDLVDKGVVTDQMVLTIGYDIENLSHGREYSGEVTTDPYGRKIPKSAHGSINLKGFTSSTKQIVEAVCELYDRICDRSLTVRRMYVVANHIISEQRLNQEQEFEQLNLFSDFGSCAKEREEEENALQREREMQKAMLKIKKMYGKNAILKGMNFSEGATSQERNKQVGGHKA